MNMLKPFDEFLSQLSETNATLDYFVDFDKIKSHIRKIEIKLTQLNYLIGKDDLKQAIEELFNENPKTFDVLDILIAVRNNKETKVINESGKIVDLNEYFNSPNKIYEFIDKTGLIEIFKNKEIKNLVDYVFGIEVGLDTNARKNRSGKNMSKAVSLVFQNHNIFSKKKLVVLNFQKFQV